MSKLWFDVMVSSGMMAWITAINGENETFSCILITFYFFSYIMCMLQKK